MFGDPEQRDHMMAGVRRAYASSTTPAHLRPHLAKRLGGSMQQQSPRKTVVGFGRTERAPIKAITTTRYADPRKTIVGSTAQPPRKTIVGSTAAPPRKTLVGSTAQPVRKTTPANLGAGGRGPLGMAAADRGPINAANPRTSTGSASGNLGRSVTAIPKPAQGPPNPVMNWAQPWNVTDIEDGGMGPAAHSMGRAPARGAKPRRRSAFYGE
jgi:hypothetical protein